jgi:lipoate-protein ligase A
MPPNHQAVEDPFPFTTWRLVQTAPAPGAWNMAVDEAILEAVGRGEALATLRL